MLDKIHSGAVYGVDVSRSMLRSLVIVIPALWLSSCYYSTTTQLWNATDPDEYIRVPEANISERSLQDKHLKYYKDDKLRVYYVEKSSLRKLGDYSVRMFAAPVTVTLDAAPAILVAGAIVMGKGFPSDLNFSSYQEVKEKQQKQQKQDIELQGVLDNIKNDNLPIPGTNISQAH